MEIDTYNILCPYCQNICGNPELLKEAVAKCPYREMCEKGFTVLMDGKLQRIRMLKPIDDAKHENTGVKNGK